jgi:DNA polymerase III delta prime subunit
MSKFKKATKTSRKLRLALYGPAGSGKTYTALGLARGLVGEAGRVAVIDTERDSASLYADAFDFDALSLARPTVDAVVGALRDAAAEGYDVVVVDSLSHAWRELLEEVDAIAARSFRGNTHSAWAQGTPKQKALVGAILGYPGHVVCTMRAKTEWVIEEDSRGKKQPRAVGLAPEQGKGIEYEFDLLGEVDGAAVRFVKDRTGRYQGQQIDQPGAPLGAELAAWLASAPPPAAEAPAHDPSWEADKGRFFAALTGLNLDYEALCTELAAMAPPRPRPSAMTQEARGKLVAWLRARAAKAEAEAAEPGPAEAR